MQIHDEPIISRPPRPLSAPLSFDRLFDDAPTIKREEPEFTLCIHDGRRPCSYILKGAAFAIGRDPSNAIRIVNRFVSRRHAYLVRVPTGSSRSGFTYCLIDGNRKGAASTNGVVVNGRRIATHYLASGDVIRFGPEVTAYFFEVAPLRPTHNPFSGLAGLGKETAKEPDY